MIERFIELFHSFSTFLSTPAGELLKRAIELIVFTIISYMLISEFRKSRKSELKYFILAFLSLMASRLLMTLTFAMIVFTNLNPAKLNTILPVIDNTLEIFAMILVANAFIYPLFKKSSSKLQGMIIIESAAILILSLIIQIDWYFTPRNAPFAQTSGFFLYELIKLCIFSCAIIIICNNRKKIGRYARDILFAFIIFLFTPITNLINFIFFSYANEYLWVVAHPFPFVSFLFFTRVVFLKLVDKAALKEKLVFAQRKYEQEKEIAKMKDEFVSIISHELRTPLTNMKLYLSLLLDGRFGGMKSRQKEQIRLIKNQGDKLANLINDVLTLSKLEAKKQKLCLKEVNLYDLVESNIYQILAKQKCIELKNNVPKSLNVHVDKNTFMHVVTNLFSNAVKFTATGGKIELGAEVADDSFTFFVEDNGKGIPKDKIPKLFDKFYQVDDHMTREEGGTGLGLAIVKKIVEMHNGKIDVASEFGKGSRFSIIIPKTKNLLSC